MIIRNSDLSGSVSLADVEGNVFHYFTEEIVPVIQEYVSDAIASKTEPSEDSIKQACIELYNSLVSDIIEDSGNHDFK